MRKMSRRSKCQRTVSEVGILFPNHPATLPILLVQWPVAPGRATQAQRQHRASSDPQPVQPPGRAEPRLGPTIWGGGLARTSRASISPSRWAAGPRRSASKSTSHGTQGRPSFAYFPPPSLPSSFPCTPLGLRTRVKQAEPLSSRREPSSVGDRQQTNN